MTAPRRKTSCSAPPATWTTARRALVKLLTGCDTDTLAEEKRRGLTIDLGFAPCRLADERIVGVVDVPGHVDFIRNMVAGAHGIDVVIFVVAADDGVMPQTREHLDILTLLGVRHGIIAMTKIDLVDAEMLALASGRNAAVRARHVPGRAPICPMSNITGEGFDGFYHALNEAVARCDERQTAGIFRVWVSDVFTIAGFGRGGDGHPVQRRAARRGQTPPGAGRSKGGCANCRSTAKRRD